MTQELESKLRKTQRRMFRSIYLIKRRTGWINAETGSSDDSSCNTIASESQSDLGETWVEWLKRTTSEIEEHIGKLGIQDWVERQR
eukprot:920227-Karenia_brevis.AAC.1